MAVYPDRGNWEIKWFRKSASTVYEPNTFLWENTDDDTLVGATSVSTTIVGICLKKVASTDSDYADNTRIPVAVPMDSSAECLCDTASTIAATDEGELHDLTNSTTVNQAASTYDIVKLKQFVSTTKGRYTVNKKAFV